MSIPLNPKKKKGPKVSEDGGMENDYLCFALAIHTLNITCQYVMTVANMDPAASIVFMGISIVVLHAVLSELMLRGLKVRSMKFLSPWFAVVLIEEIVLLSLGITHLLRVAEDPETTSGMLFREKGGYVIISTCLTAVRYFIYVKNLHSIWRAQQYQKL